MEKIYKKIKYFLTGLFLLSVIFVISPSIAEAANLYFSPSSCTYPTGTTFSVDVYVSSSDQAMNAVSGTISFSNDKVAVVSLSKTGSIFSLWAQEPSFSNSSGTISFEGVVMNPGFTGSAGKLVSMNFKAIGTGNASLDFSSSSVLANDGNGTNILANSGSALINLTTSTILQPTQPTQPPANNGVGALQISSSTHPDQNKWYNNSNPEFRWNLPQDVTAVKVLFDKNASSTPTISYSPAISQKSLQNINDGVYYFHVQPRNSSGWGGISDFRFRIDTQKPDFFNLKEISRSDLVDSNVKFSFDAKDSLSGIDHYEIKIDDNADLQNWKDDGGHIYQVPSLAPGDHNIFVKAVDRAGNFLTATDSFSISALTAPVISNLPSQLTEGQALTIGGTSLYPNATVTIFMQRGQAEQKNVQTDTQGNWSLVYSNGLPRGVYYIWAKVKDDRGAESNPTKKVVLNVIFARPLGFIGMATNYLVTIALFIFIILLLLFILYLWYIIYRRKLRQETKTAELNLETAFNNLEAEINKLVEFIDKNPGFSEEEKKIRAKMQKSLGTYEKTIAKEIRNIGKKIK